MESISVTAANVIQILFVYLCLVGVALIGQKARFTGVKLLFAYFATLMTFNLLEELGITYDIFFVTPVFTLLLGPLIYMMTHELVGKPALRIWHLVIHCCPALIAIPFARHVETVVALGAISQLFYVFYAYKLLYYYNKAVFNFRSDALSLELDWLAKIIVLITLFMVVDMIRLNIRHAIAAPVYYYWYVADLFIIFTICNLLLFKTTRQTDLLDAPETLSDPLPETTKTDTTLAHALFSQIDQQIREHALWKQPKLSLQDIAEVTGLNTKDASWAINEAAKKNFNDYTNGLRIEAVKAELLQNDSNSVLDIALACGFNSKSTFNLSFKKVEQITPTQFINLHRRQH